MLTSSFSTYHVWVMPQCEKVGLFLKNRLPPLQIRYQPNVPIVLIFFQTVHQLFEVLNWAQACFVNHKFKSVSERYKSRTVSSAAQDGRKKASAGYTRQEGTIKCSQAAESLSVLAGQLSHCSQSGDAFSSARCKTYQFKHLCSPQTLFPLLDNGKCQMSNSITIHLDYGDNEKGSFPARRITQMLEAAAAGKGKGRNLLSLHCLGLQTIFQ